MQKNNSIFKYYLIAITILVIFGLLLKLIFANKIYYSLLPLLFFFVSVGTFARAVLAGYVLYPITWYILAVGIYFGLGLFGTTIPVSEYTTVMFGTLPNFIIDIFLINTISVIIICYLSNLNTELVTNVQINNGIKELKYASITLTIGYVIIKIIAFTNFENLLLKSLFDKYGYLSNALFFILGYLYFRIEKLYKIIVLLSLSAIYIIGVLSASKFQAIIPILSFAIALLNARLSFKNLIKLAIIIGFIFISTNIIVKTVRVNGNYSENNTLTNRLHILNDAYKSIIGNDIIIKTTPGKNGEDRVMSANLRKDYEMSSVIKSVLLRFETGTIQKFVYDQYNNGYPGDSFTRIFSAVIPRIFWANKPIVVDEGRIVNTLLYPGQTTSSAAVTYVSEAYWNKGFSGVIIVSIVIGIIFSLFNIFIKKFYNGNSSYSIIVFPIILYALSIEGWLGVTFLSNFIHITFLLILAILLNSIILYRKNLAK